jgi:hypothetical protein
MRIIYSNVWLAHWLPDDPYPFEELIFIYVPVDRWPQISMAKHAPLKERKGNLPGKEDTADPWADLRKRVPDVPNDEVLERRGPLYKWGLSLPRDKATFVYE